MTVQKRLKVCRFNPVAIKNRLLDRAGDVDEGRHHQRIEMGDGNALECRTLPPELTARTNSSTRRPDPH
jgi:hypothetical protein